MSGILTKQQAYSGKKLRHAQADSAGILQKYASDPRPPHTRQKYEQTSGQTMIPNASKQGKFGSLGAIFLFIFLPCVWGLGLQKNLARGDHPNSRKKRSENGGENENISCGFPSIPGIAPGVAPRIVVFVLLKSWDAIPRMEFRIPRAAPRIFEFRELLREYPGTLPELREWPFHSESVFPKIGVVPRLLKKESPILGKILRHHPPLTGVSRALRARETPVRGRAGLQAK